MQLMIYTAQLRVELESADLRVKSIASKCLQEHNIHTEEDLLHVLAATDRYGACFWAFFPRFSAIVHNLCDVLMQTPCTTQLLSQLHTRMWVRFVRRISLTQGMLVAGGNSRDGNESLAVCVESCIDTILTTPEITARVLRTPPLPEEAILTGRPYSPHGKRHAPTAHRPHEVHNSSDTDEEDDGSEDSDFTQWAAAKTQTRKPKKPHTYSNTFILPKEKL
jgi:hypothetical protein